MPALTAPQLGQKYIKETRRVAVSFAGLLDAGETLSGNPTITSLPAGITIAGEQLNGAAVTINGRSVAANEAVLFLASAGAVEFYKLSVTVSTTNGQAFTRVLRLQVLANPA